MAWVDQSHTSWDEWRHTNSYKTIPLKVLCKNSHRGHAYRLKKCVKAHTHTQTQALLSSPVSGWIFETEADISDNPQKTATIRTPHFLSDDLWSNGGLRPHDQNYPQWPKGCRLPSGPTHKKSECVCENEIQRQTKRSTQHLFNQIKDQSNLSQPREWSKKWKMKAGPSLTFSLILHFHLAA